jgi:hypothetical protein
MSHTPPLLVLIAVNFTQDGYTVKAATSAGEDQTLFAQHLAPNTTLIPPTNQSSDTDKMKAVQLGSYIVKAANDPGRGRRSFGRHHHKKISVLAPKLLRPNLANFGLYRSGCGVGIKSAKLARAEQRLPQPFQKGCVTASCGPSAEPALPVRSAIMSPELTTDASSRR